jgi:peptide/nickel transport system permease protein
MADTTVGDIGVRARVVADRAGNRRAGGGVVPAMPKRSLQPESKPGRRIKAARAAFRRSLPLSVGTVMTVLVVILSIVAPFLSPYDPIKTDLVNALQSPSSKYVLGTDDLGRDLLTRTLWGGRIALPLAITAVMWSSIVGILLGLTAGYAGRWVDSLLMRVMDAQLALPGILLALGITAALGPSISTLILAIGIAGIPSLARLVRSQVLVIRELDYVAAARVIGAGAPRIALKHVLPGTLSNIIVALSLRAPAAITAEAGLSFLGLGVPPPTPTWGSMISAGQRYIEYAPAVILVPAVAIAITVLGLTLLGEGIRDYFDPRTRSRLGS